MLLGFLTEGNLAVLSEQVSLVGKHIQESSHLPAQFFTLQACEGQQDGQVQPNSSHLRQPGKISHMRPTTTMSLDTNEFSSPQRLFMGKNSYVK